MSRFLAATCLLLTSASTADAQFHRQPASANHLPTLARDIRNAFREEGTSYQRLIRRLTMLVNGSLYDQEWQSAKRTLVRQGFRLDERHGYNEETSATLTLRGAVFRTESGIKHVVRINISTWAQISETRPTVFKIKMLGTELNAVPKEPVKLFIAGNPYRKGTVMDYFLRLPELRKESLNYPNLSSISIRYSAAPLPLSAEFIQPHYEPFVFVVAAVIERASSGATSGETVEFTAESLLDPWKSIIGDKPKPGSFTPRDGFRDSIRFKRFGKPSSWQRGIDRATGGAITRKGWTYPDMEPKDLEIAYSAGDLRGLPAGTRSLRVLSANIQDRDLPLLTRFAQLTFLDLSNFSTGGPEHWKESALSFLAELRKLERLELGGEYVTDHAISFFNRLPNLREFKLSNSRVTAAGVQNLAALPKLEALSIAQNEHIGARALRVIGGMKRLKRLDISSIGDYTDRELAALEGLSSLEQLSIGNCKQVTSDGFRFLVQMPRLSDLSIGYMKLDDRVLNHVSACRKLTMLSLYDLGGLTDLRLAKLRTLKRIDYLSIQSCPRVTRRGLSRLMRSLPGSYTLERY